MNAIQRTARIDSSRRVLTLDRPLAGEFASSTVTVVVYAENPAAPPAVEAAGEGECPLCAACEGQKPNAETLAAIQEARGIMSGKIQAKAYRSVDEMFDEIEAEIAAEEEAETKQERAGAIC